MLTATSKFPSCGVFTHRAFKLENNASTFCPFTSENTGGTDMISKTDIYDALIVTLLTLSTPSSFHAAFSLDVLKELRFLEQITPCKTFWKHVSINCSCYHVLKNKISSTRLTQNMKMLYILLCIKETSLYTLSDWLVIQLFTNFIWPASTIYSRQRQTPIILSRFGSITFWKTTFATFPCPRLQDFSTQLWHQLSFLNSSSSSADELFKLTNLLLLNSSACFNVLSRNSWIFISV